MEPTASSETSAINVTWTYPKDNKLQLEHGEILKIKNTLDFCSWGWMKSEMYKIEVDTADELLASILDAAASIKKRDDQLRLTTRDLRTRVAKCTEVVGGVCEHLL